MAAITLLGGPMSQAHGMSTETELRSLVERYAELVDQRKFDNLATVFCPEAVLQTGNGRREGLGEIVAAMQRLHRYRRTDHRVGSAVFTVDGPEGRGTVACEAHHLDDEDRDRVMIITYHDRYLETPAGWRICERTLEIHDDRIRADGSAC